MSKQNTLIKDLINLIIENKETISLDDLVNRYTDYDPTIINMIVKELSDLNYKIISTNPIKVEKR